MSLINLENEMDELLSRCPQAAQEVLLSLALKSFRVEDARGNFLGVWRGYDGIDALSRARESGCRLGMVAILI